ncbi:MAG TPA: xanthine dehydrogenase family protein subunit M [Burkholderiales bacterium]|nr:xanthine dehydrogenase family protein subunit M [Burkholderiales bacterium]
MKAPPFAYARARHLTEVFDLLERYGDSAKILAGGQSLMPALNMRLSSPELLIDISRLNEHAGIVVKDGHVHIGALTTHAAIGESVHIRQHVPLLTDAVEHIAHPAIRNSGTFGGSLAMADPAAEWPACCVALDAQIVLASQSGTRRVAARDFFQGLYATAMQSDEVLTEVVIPIPGANYRHAFLELARRRGDYAIVGVAALAEIVEGTLSTLQLTYLGASEKPVSATKTSQVFVLKGFSEETLKEAQHLLAHEFDPAADLYSSAETKLHLARVLTARVMRQLVA